ncbi:MAG: hypothetical protein HY815_00410 [Candidatus Riflebacteria bacterium]|nr:hypothetical protein [Candidatus Riflebacteria bacterium]
MPSFRNLVMVVLFLSPALFVPGCRCIKTPASMRAKDAIAKKFMEENEQEKAGAAKASASPGATDPGSAFDTEKRLETLRQYYALKRWDAVRHEGLALVTAKLDEILTLELYLVLAEAFHESGDKERSDEFSDKFKRLYASLAGSDRMKKMGKDRESLLNLVGRFKGRGRGTADLFATPEGDERHGFRLDKKLRESKDGDVLEETLADGAVVYFSKKPEALVSRLESVDRELPDVIQRDPEFEYYYAIKEPAPPAPSRGGR